jgi:hypothetical protein
MSVAVKLNFTWFLERTALKIKICDWLIICCFSPHSWIFHLYRDVTIAGEGLQKWSICWALCAFVQRKRDLYRATPTTTRDLGFSGLIRKNAPLSHLLRHAWECRWPILSQILRVLTKRVQLYVTYIHVNIKLIQALFVSYLYL